MVEIGYSGVYFNNGIREGSDAWDDIGVETWTMWGSGGRAFQAEKITNWKALKQAMFGSYEEHKDTVQWGKGKVVGDQA